MCGILIAWDPEGLDDKPLDKGLALLRHRGPDAQAFVWKENHCLYLGHARLKIIDTSEDANQPFLSPCGRWTLVFNGEIYNFRELREEIGERWAWRTKGDTEVLMAAWTLWGENCLSRLVGMFAFAIHDAQEHTITFVKDRFGIKPLYYLAQEKRRVFASEIPPLLCFLKTVKPDNAAIRTYLELGLYDHSRHTFFKDIKSLEPGSLLRINLRSGKEQTEKWYRFADNVKDLSAFSYQELFEQAETLIVQAIKSNLIADVAVGLNVSGGVDSSMLVRIAVKELGHAHLFTQDYPGYSELPWVKEITEGGTLHVAELGMEQINRYLEATVKSQAEPFGGVFVCGYNALYEAANNERVTVLLDGNGVDEAFLGYKRYHQIYATCSSNESEKSQRIKEFESFWGHPPSPASILPGASIDGTNGLHPTVISNNLKNHEIIGLPSGKLFDDPVRQVAADDLLYAKIPRGLRFNDHVSMAHSRELRVPYLDHRLVEFAFGIPASMLLNAKGGKALFRDILARRAPKSVAYAQKRSVQSPQREWLGTGWRNRIESIIGSERFAARNWIDPNIAKHKYRTYLESKQTNSFFIWQWMNLELWAQKYLD